MSDALDELAELSADLKAWLEWEQCLGGVSWPRERVERTRPETRRAAEPAGPRASRPAAPQPAVRPAAPQPAVRPAAPRPQPPVPSPAAGAQAIVEPSASPEPAAPKNPAAAAATAARWAEYAKPKPLATSSGPVSAPLALVWTEGASPEAEAMLDRMLQGVLRVARQDIAVVTLARVREEPSRFRAALLAELDRLKPGLLLVMGTLGTRAILGTAADPAEARSDWHVLEGAAHMWAVKITHHPEHIRIKAASGDRAPRREAFEDLQAVAGRL
jgi:hypothetical protein